MTMAEVAAVLDEDRPQETPAAGRSRWTPRTRP